MKAFGSEHFTSLALLRKIKVPVDFDGTRIPYKHPKKGQTLFNEMKSELKKV